MFRMLVGTTKRVFIMAFIEALQLFFLVNKFLIFMLSFVVDNIEKYQTNLDIQSISIRPIYNPHACAEHICYDV
jgi:hypothetical protein